ncbi:ERF family protein [Massilibacteroides sp.]|uniref:ERF family protein n=1 Tax=Massilibacteroides sp. TaxID=2034766 RepID=UPI0026032CD4|nr:ERF family protein [Massilibacteroides sp.]MDD4515681.1 ERF family protein [Massilibacteroides sp.]
MKIYEKLQQARELIKSQTIKKEGKNEFSKYNYFKPVQVSQLVYNACKEVGLMTKFDLIRDQFGLTGILSIMTISDEKEFIPETIEFKMATDIPEIKATNVTQQIGGAVTYTQRYLEMVAFGIVENDADFDSQYNREKPEPKKERKIVLLADSENFQKCVVALNSGYTMQQLEKKYTISSELKTKLENEKI